MTSIWGISLPFPAPVELKYIPKHGPERTPLLSTYFPVLNRYSDISTVYHRLFVCGGQITKINLPTGSRSGESEPVSGVFPPTYLIFLHKVVKKRRSTLRIREELSTYCLKMMNSGGLHIIRQNLSDAQENQPRIWHASLDASVWCG
jgi:hypothetical protein